MDDFGLEELNYVLSHECGRVCKNLMKMFRLHDITGGLVVLSEQDLPSDREQLEEMYSRFGWKWTVLAYMAGRVVENGNQLPSSIANDLRMAKAKMESGCYSLCDVAADLRDLEINLFQVLLSVSQGEVHAMLELLGKAMNGTIQERDLDLSPLKPVLADCTIPKVCLH